MSKISRLKTLILLMAVIMLLFMACSKNNKKYADAYYEQGLVFYKSMEYDRSIDDFTKALEINSKDKENHKVYTCGAGPI